MRRSRYRQVGAEEGRSRRHAPIWPVFNRVHGGGSNDGSRNSRADPGGPKGADSRFLAFLAGAIRDWGTTFRLAFLVGVTAAALGAVLRFVRFEDQWIWVLVSALGVGDVAKFRQWRESRNDEPT